MYSGNGPAPTEGGWIRKASDSQCPRGEVGTRQRSSEASIRHVVSAQRDKPSVVDSKGMSFRQLSESCVTTVLHQLAHLHYMNYVHF